MTIRERPIEHERDAVFCGYMYACFESIDIVREYLNTGSTKRYIERQFNDARERYYDKEIDKYDY